jgi:hypothetical protein
LKSNAAWQGEYMVGDKLLKKLDKIGWFEEMPAAGREQFVKRMDYLDQVDPPYKLRPVTWDNYKCSWLATVAIPEPGFGNTIEKNIGRLAGASWGVFTPTDTKWEYNYQYGYRLSFKQNRQFYSVIISSRADHIPADQPQLYWFPPQILMLINQAITDAGYRSRYFMLPQMGYGSYFALVPKTVYQKAVSENLIPEMPLALSELLEELVKIRVDLPEINEEDLTNGSTGYESVWAKPQSESIWAMPLGDNLYAIRSVPLYAYSLHFDDVVKAVAESPDTEPKMLEVVIRSAYKTIRIKFFDEVNEIEKNRVLKELEEMGGILRSQDNGRYGLNFQPENHYRWIRDEIQRKELIENYKELKYHNLRGEMWSLRMDGIIEYELGEQDKIYLDGFDRTQKKELDFNFQLLEASRSNNSPLHEAEALYRIGCLITTLNVRN